MADLSIPNRRYFSMFFEEKLAEHCTARQVPPVERLRISAKDTRFRDIESQFSSLPRASGNGESVVHDQDAAGRIIQVDAQPLNVPASPQGQPRPEDEGDRDTVDPEVARLLAELKASIW